MLTMRCTHNCLLFLGRTGLLGTFLCSMSTHSQCTHKQFREPTFLLSPCHLCSTHCQWWVKQENFTKRCYNKPIPTSDTPDASVAVGVCKGGGSDSDIMPPICQRRPSTRRESPNPRFRCCDFMNVSSNVNGGKDEWVSSASINPSAIMELRAKLYVCIWRSRCASAFLIRVPDLVFSPCPRACLFF